ncbi:hypothetical protein [Microbulbifer magnicolonia]|uniref:hypothetical protein n=1 Tax=Microbulbifer magnicolonia TaxID=3109744 RepID=UPI002B4117BF|nr:hypothetical protein [Microbulbifer sp. GG15]
MNGNKWRRYLSTAMLGIATSPLAPVWAEEAPTMAAGGGDGDSFALRYEQAELVAQVQVTGVHRDVDNALSEPGMVAISGYVYSAVSRRVWKGEATRLVAFRRGLDKCEDKLKKGENYLIFASPDSYGRLQLLSCDAAVAESEAVNLLARLNQ